jgi:uncharacterized repeat protein (TIGR03803 family)
LFLKMNANKILLLALTLVFVRFTALDARAGVTLTNLVVFNDTNGASPQGRMLVGNDGSLYGTIAYGGTNADGGAIFGGAIYQITPGGTYKILAGFYGTNGDIPNGGLVSDADGNLYGTTQFGGTNPDYGNVFKLTPDGTLSDLISFNGINGSDPLADLYLGKNGHLYGTTAYGGLGLNLGGGEPFQTGDGTVFELTTEGVLINNFFFNYTNGANPVAGFVRGNDGNLYGTTAGGGLGPLSGGFWAGDGTVIQLTTNGEINAIASFSVTNGLNPQGDLVLGNDGNFYGTTPAGGTNGDHGTVFRVTPSGVLTSLVSFNGTNGHQPTVGLFLGPDGNFYGTTMGGGAYNYGTAFQLSPNGVLSTLISFDSTNGAYPNGALVLGADGNLYGSTVGTTHDNNRGTLFRLTVPMTPVLQSATVTNGVITLTSTAVAGLQYQVQGNTDPASTNWCNLGGLVTATNGTLTVADSCTNSQRFYRLVLVQ